MNRLGSYKLDRRKKNLLYLETLKLYSELTLRKGCNGLFFPGGTRSRSGMLEKRLKLGLLGTALEAQRQNFKNDAEDAKKIFVVPVTINYNFVLEAQSLIDQHLKKSGQEQYYVENDDFSTSTKMMRFIYKFFTASSEIAVRFGKPMDLFGNNVDNQGRSFDPHGNEVDVKKFFYSNGEITKDLQRDAEYTRMLGDKIIESYSREAVVFCSQILAFAAFRIIQARYSKMDLYGILRLPSEDLVIKPKELMDSVDKLVTRLREMYENGEIQLEQDVIDGSLANIIKKGIANLGIYHAKLPLMYNAEGDFESEDIKVLYFYHNRLEGYELHKII
jgi:glycerol-3-phosphate O-acyltransferase